MCLSADIRSLDTLSIQISTAERELAAILAERRAEIHRLEEERRALEEKVRWSRAYVAPVKRMPFELLRVVFLEVFESEEEDERERAGEHGKHGPVRWDPSRGKDGVRNGKCCPWVLASVCKSWRRLALSVPRLWSKVSIHAQPIANSAHDRPLTHSQIRITTAQSASPDNVRLWLERSGTQVPLDIDIYLRVSFNNSATPIGGDGISSHRRRRRRRSSSPPPTWAQPHILTTLAPLPWITPTPPPAWGSPPPTPPPNAPVPLHEYHMVWPPPPPDAHAPVALPHTPAELWGMTTPSPASSTLLSASSTASGSSLAVALTASAPSSGGTSTPAPHVPTAAAQAQAVTTAFTLAARAREQTVQRNMHWGYIALYYLVEHMRRWRRFVFRFERPFVSMAALKSIVGTLFLSLIRVQCIHQVDQGMPRSFKSSRCLVPIRPRLLTGPGSPVSLLCTVRLPTPPQHLPLSYSPTSRSSTPPRYSRPAPFVHCTCTGYRPSLFLSTESSTSSHPTPH